MRKRGGVCKGAGCAAVCLPDCAPVWAGPVKTGGASEDRREGGGGWRAVVGAALGVVLGVRRGVVRGGLGAVQCGGALCLLREAAGAPKRGEIT